MRTILLLLAILLSVDFGRSQSGGSLVIYPAAKDHSDTLEGTVVSEHHWSPVTQLIDRWIDSGYYPGASLIVAKAGRIVYKKYFGSYGPGTVEYVASAGKWLAAATIAAIVDEGRLSWDDQVKKWLPAMDGIKGDATLRQLLSHTSGYPDYQPAGKHRDDYPSLEESVAHIMPLAADTTPGSLFHYGGLAMQVAGRMAELATGKDWETLFQEKIAAPLQMSATHFTPVDTTPGLNPMLGGGVRTSLSDYAHFLAMIAGDGIFERRRVLSASAITQMEDDQVKDAFVPAGQFVQRVRGRNGKDVYGLGEWREEVDSTGQAIVLSSPGWAGAYPFVDKKFSLYGFFLARVNVPRAAAKGFSAFYASPRLLPLIRREMGVRE